MLALGPLDILACIRDHRLLEFAHPSPYLIGRASAAHLMTTTAKEKGVSVRSPDPPRHSAPLTITSSTFHAGGVIPNKVAFTPCGGENVSPQLSWTGFPPDTKSFCLTCFDPDAPTGSGFWHWIVANIPAHITSFEEMAATKGLPAGVVQGYTDYGASHWGGPCPPPGDSPHRYTFTVYALDIPSIEGIGPSTSGARLIFSMRGHLLSKGSIEGHFGR